MKSINFPNDPHSWKQKEVSRTRGASGRRAPCDRAAALGERRGCYGRGSQQTPQEADTAKASAALIFMTEGWGLQGQD